RFGRIAALLHTVALLGGKPPPRPPPREQDGKTEDRESIHSSLRGTQQRAQLLRVEFVEISAALRHDPAVAGDDRIERREDLAQLVGREIAQIVRDQMSMCGADPGAMPRG